MMNTYDVILLGGGPANLMAASYLISNGMKVALYEQNSQLGKKFLVAGKSGLNLSMDYSYNTFLEGYYRDKPFIHQFLQHFTPDQQRTFFLDKLGIETYVGSAGKVFPKENAVHVLKAWLTYLKQHGLEVYTHHQWQSGKGSQHSILNIKTKERCLVSSKFAIFGFGGNSWKETGSNANWVKEFKNLGIEINTFQPSNSGLKCNLDQYIFERWNGQFIKNCTLSLNKECFKGEIRIGNGQIEGSPVYHLNNSIRDALKQGSVTIYLDFKPQWSQTLLEQKWNSKYSLSKNIKHLKISNLFPAFYKSIDTDINGVEYIKKFPIQIHEFGALDKAISTIGGINRNEITSNSSLKKQEHWFINGEMIDWDAPTGGYLLSACFAIGKHIGQHIVSVSK